MSGGAAAGIRLDATVAIFTVLGRSMAGSVAKTMEGSERDVDVGRSCGRYR